MKKLAFLFLAVATFISSCKKDEDKAKIQSQKIADIIPAKYLDTLKRLGITINEGTTPPNVVGIYGISPVKSKASNVPGDVPGSIFFANAKVKFYEQNNSDFGIRLLAVNILSFKDTSLSTAISGSGNKFTVYGKVRTYSGLNTAVFGVVFSGEMDGSSIKNVQWGLINIDDSQGNGAFISEGQARLQYDIDFISESISSLRLLNTTNPKEKGIASACTH
ncbi:MAG TPA: hypothetical protein PK431_15535 [Chitinophagales bacterium]|nr:hypothetical protein [Chitinophagales bacterium]